MEFQYFADSKGSSERINGCNGGIPTLQMKIFMHVKFCVVLQSLTKKVYLLHIAGYNNKSGYVISVM